MSTLCPYCGYDLKADEPVQVGPYEMQPYGNHLGVNGQKLRLTPSESALAYTLLRAAPRVVTHVALIERLGIDSDNATNVLQVQLSKLRKLFRDVGHPSPIMNHWGTGYSWRVSA